MRGRAAGLVWFILLGTCQGTYGLELHLVTMKRSQLAGEPADLQLFFVNNDATPAYVARGLLTYDRVRLGVDGDWLSCGLMSRGTPGTPEIRWERIDPGSRLSIGMPGFWCPDDAGPISNYRDWRYTPGEYRLEVQVSHHVPHHIIQRAGPAPAGFFEGTLRSEAVQVSVEEPAALDAEALQWAKKHGHDPVSLEVASRFPESHYAALVAWQAITIGSRGPAQMHDLLAKKLYPDSHTVPDASEPEGTRKIDRVEEMARWRIDKGTRLLQEHPSFPQARGVQLSMAISYAALGRTKEATRMLKALAKDAATPEGAWANEFLALKDAQPAN